MDDKSKMIISFCEGEITFEELADDIKADLISSEMVNESGEFTTRGNSFKKAITAKFDPDSARRSANEWPNIFRP